MMKQMVIGALLMAAAVAFAGRAVAQSDREYGFLRFSAGGSLNPTTEAIKVTVGLFADKDGKPSEKVWFSAVYPGRDWSLPSKFRWTDSERCPHAMPVLRRVRSISMPKAVLPLPDPEKLETQEKVIVTDGRSYTLDVSASDLEGQMTDEFRMSSNVDTSLSRWIEEMLTALKPCWSETVPQGVDPMAGSKWDADAHRR